MTVRSRRSSLAACGALAALVALALAGVATRAPAQSKPTKVTLKGRVVGGDSLLNPVWNEAKEPGSHRYTFREPSTTVAESARRLTAYLPKELCVAVLKPGPVPASGAPAPMHVSGGRTTPVTIVIPEGQKIQFINHDPFAHKLFDPGKGGLGPEEMPPNGQRAWQPPKAGVYELRDKSFPSVRSWIVVEPRVAAIGFPTLGGELTLRDLEPGSYELQAFFGGKAIGKALAIKIDEGPEIQQLREPLVVGEAKGKGDAKDKDAKDKDAKDKGGKK
jgi:hypothetical protein